VCPPAPALAVLAPSDMQKISTGPRVDSHPFPGAVPPSPSTPGPASGRRCALRHLVCNSRVRVCAPTGINTYQPRTGTGHPSTGRAGSTVRCGTLFTGRLYDPPRGGFDGEPPATSGRPTFVGRAARGNQPISRRVDTISKQYQASGGAQCVSKPYVSGPHMCGMSSTRTAYVGGGATWES